MLQTCRNPWCKQSFDITQDDLLFYDQVSPVFAGKKFAVPPPPLCPDCRRQRRYLFRNERNLYRRSCDLCKKQIVSVYQQEAPFPVYCNRCWWSDQWDPFASGVHYDPASPLLEQWISLRNRTPQLAIQNDNTAGSDILVSLNNFEFKR